MIDIHNLHLNYITNPQGEQTAVMLPMNEFLELMEDVEDLISIASRKNEPTTSHENLLIELANDGFI